MNWYLMRQTNNVMVPLQTYWITTQHLKYVLREKNEQIRVLGHHAKTSNFLRLMIIVYEPELTHNKNFSSFIGYFIV